MDRFNRLRERYERKLRALDTKEQVLSIVKWVAAALAAAGFIFGVVKGVMLLTEKLSGNKTAYIAPDASPLVEENPSHDTDLPEYEAQE